MKETVVSDISVKVGFFMEKDLNVGAKYERGIDSIETEPSQVVLENVADKIQGEGQGENEDWVDALDSAGVKVDEGEFVVLDLPDHDSCDEIPWYDEKYVHSDEPSWDCLGKCVVNQDRNYGNSSQTINFWSIGMSWFLSLLD